MPGAAARSSIYNVGDLHCLEELEVKVRGWRAPALHEHLVVRHEGMCGARPMPGALATGRSFLHFVGDFHRLEELEVSGVLGGRHRRVADLEVVLQLGGKDLTVVATDASVSFH